MQRQICWTERRQEDGEKREVRVTVNRREVKWQFKRLSEERWDYKSPATLVDWDNLLERVQNRYHRRTAAHEELELVRRLREGVLRSTPPTGDPPSSQLPLSL